MSAPPAVDEQAEALADPTLYPPLVRILVDAPVHRSEHRWSGETAGLVVATLEASLVDLPRVVPEIAGKAPTLGLEDALMAGSTEWHLSLEIEYLDDDRIKLFAKLCPQPGSCVGGHGEALRTAPGPAVANVVIAIAEAIGVEVADGLVETWHQPVSEDGYAALLAGRAAAKLYGFMEPVAPKLWGHRTADPSERAVMVDPTMGLAHWVRARESVARDKPRQALDTLDRAFDEGVHRSGLYAARARILTRMNRWENARGAWDAVAETSPLDARYAIPRTRAYLENGAPTTALDMLAALPEPFRETAAAAELNVAIAEAIGPGDDYEDLLRKWAAVSSKDPEPLRRQVAYRLRLGRNAEALALLRDLEDRGAGAEARELAIAIGNELGRYEEAAQDAANMGFAELARRIRTRAGMDSNQDPDPAVLAASGNPEETLVAARMLVTSAPKEALQLTDRLLRRDPWMPELLAVRIRALEALGDEHRLAKTRKDLRLADPALYASLGGHKKLGHKE
ncbi:MAG: tetratricopeptide (TPR) repeat protein [Hyphomicrobiaceae bacterium]|jgi:tetratricopeptide (TPR) repeat protein